MLIMQMQDNNIDLGKKTMISSRNQISWRLISTSERGVGQRWLYGRWSAKGAEAGKEYVIPNSLQIIQALGRTGKQELSEVLHNFPFWRGQLAVKGKWKLATRRGKLKGQ